MARLIPPWLRLGMLFVPVLTGCLSEHGSDGAGAGNGTGGSGGSGTGALPATGGTSGLGGGGTSTGASSPGATGGAASGGTPAATGGVSAGGAEPTTGGTSTGGVADTGGIAANTGGSLPTGGSGALPGDDTVCGTADEDEGITLTCPEGLIIDSVVFASYGTPSGTCGAFAIGDCHSESSESRINSLCVGRTGCIVSASNSTFGDPCSNVVKSLAVEVACVEGDPIVTEGSPFKGLANSPASEIEALGATWCYNWGTTPQVTDCNDPFFVPMIWGDSGDAGVADAIAQVGNAGYDTVLGFNEPNKVDPQSDISVARAIELWPIVTSNPNIRVGSPAVSDDGRAWLQDFMSQVQANGLRVDFIAMHWYGWNEGSCTADALEGAINWAEQWGLPVWITEFGCMGSSNPDEQTLLDFFPAAAAMIERHPMVERYAWYPWNTYNHVYLEDENGVRVITALGEAFAAAPPYRQ